MKVKRIIAAFLSLIIAASIMPAMVLANTEFETVTTTVVVDGFEISTDAVTVGSTVLVPFRFLEEAVGAIASYNPRSRRINIRTAGFVFELEVGRTQYRRNGTNRTLAVAPVLVDGVPFVPMYNIVTGIGGVFGVDLVNRLLTVTYFSDMSGTVIVSGSTTLYPFTVAAADHLNELNPRLTINVSGGGSGAGRNAVIDRTSHIGMDSGTPNDAQRRAIREFIPVAFDAVAIVVHPSNPVYDLSMEDARAIFLGEITNWNQVGGNNAPIIVHVRDGLSGTGDTVQSMLLGGTPWIGTATPHASNGLQRNGVSSDPNAIGFLSVGYLDGTVSGVSLNGIVPNFETVSSGAYPLSRNLNLLSRQRPTGSAARFIDFIRSAHGQAIVAEAEFLPIRPLQ